MSASPVGDEAGKLLAALQQWLGGYAKSVPIATGSPECCVCPLCQLISLARAARPEVFEHLSGAATEAFAAFRAFLDVPEAGTSQPGPHGSGNDGGVERIDVED
jgi:hypothetical protein